MTVLAGAIKRKKNVITQNLLSFLQLLVHAMAFVPFRPSYLHFSSSFRWHLWWYPNRSGHWHLLKTPSSWTTLDPSCGPRLPPTPDALPNVPQRVSGLSSETFQFFTSWPPSTLHSALSFSISSSSAGEDPCCHAASVLPEPASDSEGTYCGKKGNALWSLKHFDWSRAHRPFKLTQEMRKMLELAQSPSQCNMVTFAGFL